MRKSDNARTPGGWLRWTLWVPFHVAGYVCGRVLASDPPWSVSWIIAVVVISLGAPAGVALLVTREWPREREG